MLSLGRTDVRNAALAARMVGLSSFAARAGGRVMAAGSLVFDLVEVSTGWPAIHLAFGGAYVVSMRGADLSHFGAPVAS